MGIISLLDRVTSWLPIQRPAERLRNELDALEKEKALLLVTKCDEKNAKRVDNINCRIAYLNRLLKNKAQ